MAEETEGVWQVIGGSGRMLFEGTKQQCEDWVGKGNVGGSYSIERQSDLQSCAELVRLREIGDAFERVLGRGRDSRILGAMIAEGVTALDSHIEAALREYSQALADRM